ncbi:class I SAM-dependent methyltransferase [Methanocella sp. MCL-LM]|uniref:class I SAM-dependent methyltransferase n=1 Tax=Methanocella sp. MCL-LM TaxID=3412035 RepID=UPI003C77B60B
MRKIEKICELLDLDRQPRDVNILEIGTGTGIHAAYLIGKYPEISYTGVDISQGMLNVAQRKLGREAVRLVSGDGHRLPFKSFSFDAVFISGSLHHFNNPCAGICEAFRVLKNHGKLAIMEPNWLFPTNLLPAIANKQERGIMKMTPGNFIRWSRATDLSMPIIGHMLYTPPVPAAMSTFYDMADKILMQIPGISQVSIMIYMSGIKQE